MAVECDDAKEPYVPPTLRALTSEQAKLICIPYAWVGHKGARELLELMFPDPAATSAEHLTHE
jgi:hypothetical protein